MKKFLSLLTLTLIWLMWSCNLQITPSEQFVASSTPTFQTKEPTRTPAVGVSSRIAGAFTETLEPTIAIPDMAGTVVAKRKPRIFSSLLSPDGRWRADIVIYGCVSTGEGNENAYEQLSIIQVDKDVMKVADSQLQYCGGLGAFGLEGLFWSSNNRYLYYTNAREGGPDGCGFWERPLLRVDVNHLKGEYLGSGSRSPDGTKLATRQGQDLVVWDTNGGEIVRIPAIASNLEIGPLTWSPESRALVYIQLESYCPLSGRSYIVRVDLPGFEQTRLMESETPTFGGVAWDIPDELKLFDENGMEWRYDFNTKEIKQVP